MFWNCLEAMDEHQRRLFIRFSWAQERLPLDDAEFHRTHTRLLIKPSPYANADAVLPRSDTCFFNLELPNYSSQDVMMQKLLYAITSDSSMNGDAGSSDSQAGSAAWMADNSMQ
jgi:other hect domain ubiquitin protein ligase E3